MSTLGAVARTWAVRRRTALPRLAILLRAARPRQWVKAGLVVAAPAAAGTLGDQRALERLALAFVTFCLASAGTYLVNDVRDVEQDRRHPEKRRRPIAAGDLPIRAALAAAAAAMAASLALASLVGTGLLAVIAGYLALTTAYSLRLRRIAGLDVAAVAGCFVLRAAGGGAATGVPLSGWFLAVVALAACFVALGKRLAESGRLGEAGLGTRATLGIYRPAALRVACPLLAAAAVAVYALWALGHPGRRLGIDWAIVSVLPFALAMARYLHQLGRGHGESPERLAVRDPVLILAALGWTACFAVATYLGS